MARDIRAVVCPLSVIQDIPRVVMGGEDTNVYIYNVAGARCPVKPPSIAFDQVAEGAEAQKTASIHSAAL